MIPEARDAAKGSRNGATKVGLRAGSHKPAPYKAAKPSTAHLSQVGPFARCSR